MIVFEFRFLNKNAANLCKVYSNTVEAFVCWAIKSRQIPTKFPSQNRLSRTRRIHRHTSVGYAGTITNLQTILFFVCILWRMGTRKPSTVASNMMRQIDIFLRAIDSSYRDRSAGTLADNLALQIQFLPWIPSNFHHRYRLRARNEFLP